MAKASSSRVEQVADTIESKDAGRVSVATMLKRKAEFSNKTAGVDCVVPSLLKLFGMRTASKFADVLNMEYGQWPEETRQVLHMTLHKSTGFDVNKNTRPIKVLSALLRIQAKLLAPMVQTLTRPRWSAGGQFAGYKGSSVHGMRRLMHILITQALATKGAVGVMLLDIVGAYDEVISQSIKVMAAQGPPAVRDVVHRVLDMYESLRTYVVTAYGLSEWYSQLDGVLQGGGLDPVLYIMAMHPMHLAVREMQQGVPVTIDGGREVVGTMGYVDDTAAAAAAPPKEVAQETQALANTLRGLVHALG